MKNTGNFILGQSRMDTTREVQLTPHKRSAVWGLQTNMKHIITLLLLLVTFTVAAQSYSPCYTEFMAKGNAAYNQGKYSEAKTYYAKAKQCAGGNPTEAQKKISACEMKLENTKESVAYGTGNRGYTYMPDLTVSESGVVFVEVHIDTEGNVIDARVVSTDKYPTTITDKHILEDCVARAKTAKYRKGKEELRIIVFK